MTVSRVRGLDGIRALAIIPVVAYHADLTPSGFLGVDLFFVLSGYLITSQLLAEHRRAEHLDLSRFYLRRLLRLWPALLVLVLVCVALGVAAGKGGTMARDGLVASFYLANLLGVAGGLLDHTWTLALEEQFYLAWPALLWLTLRRRRVTSRASVWQWWPSLAVVGVVLVADLVHGGDGALHSYVRAMGLPIGCGLAVTFHRWSGWSGLRRAGLAGLVLLVALFLVPLPAWLSTGWPVSIGAVVAAVVVATGATGALDGLTPRWVAWIGQRSYSLYLWHFRCSRWP